MEPVRFALVGLDHWYNALPMAEAINVSPNATLLWVADEREDRAQAIAQKYQACAYASDYQRVLSDPRLDVVACYVSSDKSADLCLEAAQAGKHIISIKPFAMDLEEADRIVAAVKHAGVKYFPGAASQLFAASNILFRGWIEAGRIGEVVGAAATFHAGLPRDWPDSTVPGWFANPTRVPGGAWIDHGIFYTQLFRAVLGSEIVRAEGSTANLKYPNVDVEDYGQAIFTFANGAVATITSTWLGAPGAHRQSVEFLGTEGTLRWDSLLGSIAVAGEFSQDLSGWLHSPRPPEGITRTVSMVEHLVTCIRDNQTPMCDVDDDRSTLAASLAFYAAAHSHTAADIPVSIR